MTVVSDFTAILSSSIASAPGKAAFYTFSFAATPPAYLSGFYTPAQLATFRPLSDAEKAVARSALDAWASISGLTLFEVSSGVGDINFGIYDLAALDNPEAGGFAFFGSGARFGVGSDIFLSAGSATSPYVVLHEIGHALGLKHTFEGDITLDPAVDDFSHTVMSYTARGADGSVLGTFDVQAIQHLYGNASSDGSQVASFSWNQTTETLTQTGGATDDVIAGVAVRDVINGGGGNDTITSGSGGDSVDGGEGNDTIKAVATAAFGSAQIAGGLGSDTIEITFVGQNPAFRVDGGDGTDRATFFLSGTATTGIDITLSGNGTTGGLVVNVEKSTVFGTGFADRLTGSAGSDDLVGSGGNDTLLGMGGNDNLFANIGSGAVSLTLDGGEGDDQVAITLDSPRPDLSSQLQLAGGTGTDSLFLTYRGQQGLILSLADLIRAGSTVTGFEFIGLNSSSGDDRITGSDLADSLQGGGGADILTGGRGKDSLFGQDGADRFVFTAVADSPLADSDVIADFVTGVDVLDLSAIQLWNVQVTPSGSNLVTGVGLDGDFRVFVNGTIALSDVVRQTVGLYRAGTAAADVHDGQSGKDYLLGGGGNDRLAGMAGDDFLSGGLGTDTAIYAATRAAAAITRTAGAPLSITSAADGTDTVSGVELFQFTDGTFSLAYADPGGTRVQDFTVNAGGWSSQDRFPRHVADVNGDGFADIVGFGQAGTLVALGSAGGTFAGANLGIADFGQAQGWSADNTFHRKLADVNGDKRADIVGFGIGGVLVSLAQANGTFAAPTFGSTNFNPANGWSSQDSFTRTLADVNGDGFADVVGFGIGGTFVALGTGSGSFGAASFALGNFGANQGWSSDNTFHREVGDVNGDGRADIVGFGIAGTLIALGQTNGTFAAPTLALANFGTSQGWSSQDEFTRDLGDVNGDGLADVVGFGIAGAFVAYGQADGSLSAAGFDVANFGKNQGWTSDNILHRELADLNGDKRADVLGFGFNGVFGATAMGG